MDNLSVENISSVPATYDEETSYGFLQYYQFANDWYVYDSDELGVFTVKFLADKFAAFHGKIPFIEEKFPSEFVKSFWSALPIAVFKFKFLEDQSFYLIQSVKKVEGYIVQGAYWQNGFFYVVTDKEEIIQVKLFINQETKEKNFYPDKELI